MKTNHMMTHKRTILLIIGIMILVFIVLDTKAQDAVDERMYKAYLSDKPVNEEWTAVVASRKAQVIKSATQANRLQLAIAHYGLLCSTMRTKDEELFDDYYKEAEKNLDAILAIDKKSAEAQALLSAIYGLRISYSPFQGMFLGPKCGNLVDKAKTTAPTSALVWKIYANSKYFTPDMWGGDLEVAVQAYDKSIQLFEENPAGLKYNWLYLDAIVFAGLANLKNGDTAKAISLYEKSLALEPELGWVKNKLLPKARAKASK